MAATENTNIGLLSKVSVPELHANCWQQNKWEIKRMVFSSHKDLFSMEVTRDKLIL